MSLAEKIIFDLKGAQKTKDKATLGVLRLLSAAIHNKEIEKRTKLIRQLAKEQGVAELEELSKLTDEEVIGVISSEVKKRKEAIEQYKKGGRDDLVAQEKKELEILTVYLPMPMPEDEIRQIIKDTIKELGVTGPQNFGMVMGALMPKLKGKAEGDLVSKLVREELQGN